ncbi:MAG: amidohydrolase family protein [Gammaproteobacteria bacterium]|nr:amidohydrolase family protein [Gammaproteobacteria bacterium]
MKLASGISPVNPLIKQGANIALGTDSSASNNDLDMFGEMKSAALLAKISTMDATALNAETVLSMATINGAKALHLDDKIGSLEVGKDADICAVNINTINSSPMYHPISQLVYACQKDQVSDVWVEGKQLLKQRQLTRMDTNQILEHAKLWQQKLQPLK